MIFTCPEKPSGYITSDTRTSPLGLQVKVQAAAEQLVTTEAAKNYLRQKAPYDDADIAKFVLEMQSKIQRFLNKAVGVQTLMAEWSWVYNYVDLPYSPHARIINITSIDKGVETALTSNDYYVEGLHSFRVFLKKYQGKGLKVEYQTGTVQVTAAIYNELGIVYKNRGDSDQPAPPIDLNTGLSLQTLAMLNSMKKGML